MNPNLKFSILAALSAISCFFLANDLLLENPYWSLITVAVLFSTRETNILYKSILRVFGTLIGALSALVVISLTIDIKPLFIFLAFLVMSFYFHRTFTRKHHYAWLLSAITFLMGIMLAIVNPKGVASFMYWRILEISLGVSVCCFFQLFIKVPISAMMPTPTMLNNELLAMRAGFVSLLNIYAYLLTNWFGAIQGIITSTIIMTHHTLSLAQAKSTLRVSGCLLGGCIGLGILVFLPQNLFVTSVILGFSFFVVNQLQMQYPQYNYVFLQAIIALCLAIIPPDGQTSSNIIPAIERLAGMFMGISISLLISLLLPISHQLRNQTSETSLLIKGDMSNNNKETPNPAKPNFKNAD